MATTAAERRYILDSLAVLAARDIRLLWGAASRMDDIDFASFVSEAFPQVVDPYRELAAETAAVFYAADHPDVTRLPVTAPPVPREKLLTSAQWALGGNGTEAVDRMIGTAQRAVYDGDRETTVLNAEIDEKRWVRVAQAGACAFCRMLASRAASDDISFTYQSVESAITVVGRDGQPRGSRQIGELYHDHCNCIAVTIPGEMHPMDYLELIDTGYADLAQQWDDQYRKARAEAGTGNTKEILAAWRQLGAS